MFLKTLTLKGFKSFAESTTVELEPGLTVVVGPNGSGKSNVVDAVAWVLGAQGPRTVRSSKMDDVIFAGTADRPALGRAEVLLTIDNSSGTLPIELTEVTISRTLFRSGESEYAINGVPCRLLDVQELLSDSGVGRQQHVIVSQGQLDGILSARPEDRRAVIEEAAGVLKYRKRKEKAERRLEATEGNLLRLQDLLREVRRQIRPLERQADAARRHGELVAELTALRVHLSGRELASLRSRLETAGGRRSDLKDTQDALRRELADLDTAVAAAENELSSVGGAELADVLVRVERLREQARGLTAVLAERRRGIERDRSAFVDRAVVATLEAESARLREELAEVDRQAGSLRPDAERLAAQEARLVADREAFDATRGEDAPASTLAAEVRGELSALRNASASGENELARADARLTGLDGRRTRLEAEHAELEAGRATAIADATRLEREADSARARLAVAVAASADAEDRRRAADGEHHRWVARADALAQALEEARSQARVERLSEVGGVLGTLLDLVDVDAGWEVAFDAAVGPALAAAVVDGPDAARRALEVLVSEGSGTVLPLGSPPPPAAPPAVGEPVRHHVRGLTPAIDHFLDALIGHVVAVPTWAEAIDTALAVPGATIVTRSGDRFSPSGWRVGASGSGATAAALDEAERRAREAAATAERVASALVSAREAEASARAEATASEGRLEHVRRELATAEEGCRRVEAAVADTYAELDALRAHREELRGRVGEQSARLSQLEQELPALESREAEVVARNQALHAARSELEERTAAVAALRTDLEVRAASLDERRSYLRRRLDEIEERLTRDATERQEAATLRGELDSRLTAVDRLTALVAARLAWLDEHLTALRERRRRQSDAARAAAERLDRLRRDRQAAERKREDVREDARRVDLDEAELRLRLETAVEALRRDLDCEPDAAIAAPCPLMSDGTTPSARARELERELRLMGPVNPLALEELTSLQERHEFLQEQLDDVKRSRRELTRVIRAVDEEIVRVFLAAFADVSENFTRLFETLFPGGQGRLRLTEPADPLATGVEVEARPSGKNVRKLSLLSGGERSLTALAFLFAVFRSRPSPFYLLDEVEAALDDVNLNRFLDLVEEFRREAQLVIVTHQKRTMEVADCLYGVSMQAGGSSKVVSERLRAGA